MRRWNGSRAIVCFAVCAVAIFLTDEARPDIVYSFAGTLDSVTGLDPAMRGDAFIFEFVVDDSVVEDNGDFINAIVSSSFDIENISIDDDFANGNVMVSSSSLTFFHPTNRNIGFSFSGGAPLNSGALPQSTDFERVFFVLANTSSGFGGGTGTVNAVPEPAALPLLLLVSFSAFLRTRVRHPLISTDMITL